MPDPKSRREDGSGVTMAVPVTVKLMEVGAPLAKAELSNEKKYEFPGYRLLPRTDPRGAFS